MKSCDAIVRTMLAREKEGKEFGVIVMAEGLAEFLPGEFLQGVPRDEHGQSRFRQVNFCRKFAKLHRRRIQSARPARAAR